VFEKAGVEIFLSSEHEQDEKDGGADYDLEGTRQELALFQDYIKEKLDKELQHIG
jgi:hypothetical protein